MRIRWTAAFLVAAALASTPALAQSPNDKGSVPTETQEGQDSGKSDLIWNLIGCLGLIGLTGFWRSSDNDGYTNDPI
jgi:hypothetical protein